MNIVSTMPTKEDRIYIRVTDEIKEKFKIVAEHRGLKMSALLHSLVVKTVREEEREYPLLFSANKEREPDAFKKSTEFIEVEDRGKLDDDSLIHKKKIA